MSDALWFNPVCDQVLAKLVKLYLSYESGAIYSTRAFVTKDGRTVAKPTRFANQVALKANEVGHVVRILQTIAPDNPLVAEWQKVQAGLKNGRTIPGGDYVVTLAWYQQDVIETIQLLLKAKTGQAQTVDDFVVGQKQEGRELFEV
jgi:hypothetical protein